MVVFSSLEFMFRFLPVFLIVYYLTPYRYRNAVLFLGSILFYASGAKWFVLLLLAGVVVNWLMGRLVWTRPGRRPSGTQKQMLIGIIALDAGILVLCKVLALTVSASLLPLGLSFYTFKMISYQMDLYQGKIRRRPNFIKTAVYFTMFAQITEGPIMRYEEGGFITQKGRRVSPKRFEDGLIFFVLGLGMKVLLADRIGILWNEIGKIGYDSISTPLAWLGAFAYSFQLYFDFWGYSLMAGGVGLMLGFKFITNFRHPYAANGIGDFYRRWHATLGSWFRDYLYFPLGGSRVGQAKTIRNLMIVWAVTGFWHGGTLNFIIWGLVLGALIVYEKFVAKDWMKKWPILGHLHVWILIPLTWVIFAITDLGQLGVYFGRLFPLFSHGTAVDAGDFGRYFSVYWPFFLVSLLLCVPGIFRLMVRKRKTMPMLVILVIIFWVSLYYVTTSASNPFMYFSF